jgi:thiol-disulfide isomerase/thioredoxin
VAGLAWITASRVPPDATNRAAGQIEAPIAGYLAPTFTLDTVNGESISLADLSGRPVVLNFWATWCPPCRIELPHFQEASIRYNGRVTILGVDQGEPAGVVAPFAAELGLSYPLALDGDSRVNRLYRVNALPTTVFVDAEGVVDEVYLGIINGAVLEERIERLLEGG